MISYPTHYRARYLGGMALREILAIPDKARSCVVIPTGAIEQHGPHLPVGVDSMLGQAWLNLALPLLPEHAPVYVAPALTYGKSNEHTGFPGTASLGKTEFSRLFGVIVRQLLDWGFTRQGVLNTHGGNTSLLDVTMRELRLNHPGLDLRMLPVGGGAGDLPGQEAAYGFHAGTLETAWMLHLAPGLCRMDQAVTEYPASVNDPGGLKPENAPATFAWISSDLSRSGVMGDARAATPEQGRVWMQEGAEALAKVLLDWAGTAP